MFFALALLLIQPQVNPHMGFSAEKIAFIQPANELPADSTSLIEDSLPMTPDYSDVSLHPTAVPETVEFPTAPVPAPANTPTLIAFLKSGKPRTVSVSQMLDEERHKQLVWMGLGIAVHGAATFDAWSTRRAITTAGAQEMDPLLKPFAGNASLYAAIQVGPALMDFVGRKMMYSRHNWVRRMWWLPQSASFASSLFCGAHNLGVH